MAACTRGSRALPRLLVAAATLAVSTAQSDTQCGNATFPLSSTGPNVLIVGDSISMAVPYTPGGYGVNVQQLLGQHGIAVQHAGGWYSGAQCSNTVKGLLCTNSSTPNNYLNFSGTFDVVHMNYGLHDLEGANFSEHVPLPVYGANLVTLYNRFATKAKSIIWTATTPVPNVPQGYGRTYQAAVDYNTQALASLKSAAAQQRMGALRKGGELLPVETLQARLASASTPSSATALAASVAVPNLVVDDLWTVIINVCGVNYSNCSTPNIQIPDNVHFLPGGQALLGQHAATSILSVLQAQGWVRDGETGEWSKRV